MADEDGPLKAFLRAVQRSAEQVPVIVPVGAVVSEDSLAEIRGHLDGMAGVARTISRQCAPNGRDIRALEEYSARLSACVQQGDMPVIRHCLRELRGELDRVAAKCRTAASMSTRRVFLGRAAYAVLYVSGTLGVYWYAMNAGPSNFGKYTITALTSYFVTFFRKDPTVQKNVQARVNKAVPYLTAFAYESINGIIKNSETRNAIVLSGGNWVYVVMDALVRCVLWSSLPVSVRTGLTSFGTSMGSMMKILGLGKVVQVLTLEQCRGILEATAMFLSWNGNARALVKTVLRAVMCGSGRFGAGLVRRTTAFLRRTDPAALETACPRARDPDAVEKIISAPGTRMYETTRPVVPMTSGRALFMVHALSGFKVIRVFHERSRDPVPSTRAARALKAAAEELADRGDAQLISTSRRGLEEMGFDPLKRMSVPFVGFYNETGNVVSAWNDARDIHEFMVKNMGFSRAAPSGSSSNSGRSWHTASSARTPAVAPSVTPSSARAPSVAPSSARAPSVAPSSARAPSVAPSSARAPSVAPSSARAPSVAPSSARAPSVAPSVAPSSARAPAGSLRTLLHSLPPTVLQTVLDSLPEPSGSQGRSRSRSQGQIQSRSQSQGQGQANVKVNNSSNRNVAAMVERLTKGTSPRRRYVALLVTRLGAPPGQNSGFRDILRQIKAKKGAEFAWAEVVDSGLPESYRHWRGVVGDGSFVVLVRVGPGRAPRIAYEVRDVASLRALQWHFKGHVWSNDS